MTVKELKEILSEVDDELQVFFPMDEDNFFSPCHGETGILEEDGEEPIFVLAPHGFFEGRESNHTLN